MTDNLNLNSFMIRVVKVVSNGSKVYMVKYKLTTLIRIILSRLYTTYLSAKLTLMGYLEQLNENR